MPGTIDQWPNWSQALPQPLEEIETLPLPKRIAERLRRSPQYRARLKMARPDIAGASRRLV